MTLYLKTVWSNLCHILKRQRGDNTDLETIQAGMNLFQTNYQMKFLVTEVTTTKSIDNFFGNWYRKLNKIGSIGLNKGTNDFNMKYSKNLIQPKVCL